jgi:hypothetical protein
MKTGQSVSDILARLKGVEKTASEQFLAGLTNNEQAGTPAPAPVQATEKVASATATPAASAPVEATTVKIAMEAQDADMMGRMIARSFYDELMQLGIMPMTNYPAPGNPIPEGVSVTPHAAKQIGFGLDGVQKTASAEESANEAESIIANLYKRYNS